MKRVLARAQLHGFVHRLRPDQRQAAQLKPFLQGGDIDILHRPQAR
jgi:hypothetical protein